ncbi:MAG: dipeptidase [Planctomycetota bacterium]|jgi:membrane dipeptidase
MSNDIKISLGVVILLPAALLAYCWQRPILAAHTELRMEANELARKYLIIDTHQDVPYRLRKKMEDISQRTEGGNFDYPRAREGGLDAVFMAVYIPPEYEEKGGAFALANEEIDMVEGFARDWPEKFTMAASVAEVKDQFGAGRISLAMGIENGAPLEGNLANVKYFYDRGVRYITLAHSKSNHICDSSFDEERKWNGLSPFGKEVVAEMNRLGMIVDVSHVSDRMFPRIPFIRSFNRQKRLWLRHIRHAVILRRAGNAIWMMR